MNLDGGQSAADAILIPDSDDDHNLPAAKCARGRFQLSNGNNRFSSSNYGPSPQTLPSIHNPRNSSVINPVETSVSLVDTSNGKSGSAFDPNIHLTPLQEKKLYDIDPEILNNQTSRHSPPRSPLQTYMVNDSLPDLDSGAIDEVDQHKDVLVELSLDTHGGLESLVPIRNIPSPMPSEEVGPLQTVVREYEGSRNPNPGLLEKAFASDFYGESSEVDVQHDSSSDDDRPVALAKAIPSPLRCLHMQPPNWPHSTNSDYDTADGGDSDLSYPPGRKIDSGVHRERPYSSAGRRRTGSEDASSPRSRSTSGEPPRREYYNSSDGDEESDGGHALSNLPKERARRLAKAALSNLITTTRTKRTEQTSTTLPKAANAKARRILVPKSTRLPLVTISMRADANFLDRNKQNLCVEQSFLIQRICSEERHCSPRISRWSIPNKDELCHVEDACIVGDTVVIGYNHGPYQVSLIPLVQVSTFSPSMLGFLN